MKTSLRLALVAIVGVAALSGCMRFTADLRLEPDNTVDGTYVVAVAGGTGASLGVSDREAAQKLYDDSGLGSSLEHSMQRAYRGDGYTGLQIQFRGEDIERFAPTAERFGVIRDGDEFVVSGPSSDVSEEDADALAGADLRVTIEFPGLVTASNGTADGNTVTWDLVGGPDELNARGSAVPSGSPLPAILATLLVLGAAAGVVYSRRGASARPKQGASRSHHRRTSPASQTSRRSRQTPANSRQSNGQPTHLRPSVPKSRT